VYPEEAANDAFAVALLLDQRNFDVGGVENAPGKSPRVRATASRR